MLNASYIIIKSLTWFFLFSSYNKEVDEDKNDEDKNNETADDNSSDQRCVRTIWNTNQMEHKVTDYWLILSDKAIILIFIIIVVYFVFDKSEKKN